MTGSAARGYNVKIKEEALVLRYYGSSVYNPWWSVQARMEEDSDGVLLIGRLRYPVDRFIHGISVLFTTVLLSIAVWLAATQGLGREAASCLGAATVIGLLTAFNLMWLPRVTRKREMQAKHILSNLLGTPVDS